MDGRTLPRYLADDCKTVTLISRMLYSLCFEFQIDLGICVLCHVISEIGNGLRLIFVIHLKIWIVVSYPYTNKSCSNSKFVIFLCIIYIIP